MGLFEAAGERPECLLPIFLVSGVGVSWRTSFLGNREGESVVKSCQWPLRVRLPGTTVSDMRTRRGRRAAGGRDRSGERRCSEGPGTGL